MGRKRTVTEGTKTKGTVADIEVTITKREKTDSGVIKI